MHSTLCFSRFSGNRQGRQCYDPHISLTIDPFRATSVSRSFHRTGPSVNVDATSFYHMAVGASVAWINNSDGLCIVEAETFEEPISKHISGVFRRICFVSSRRSIVATTRSGCSSPDYSDAPSVGVAFVELFSLWILVWKRPQHQVLPRCSSRISCQLRFLCVSVRCDWFDCLARITRPISAMNTFLNQQIDKA